MILYESKWTFWFSWLNWPWRTTQLHTVWLCLHLVDPDTFLATNSVVGTLFSSEDSLFIQLWKNIYFCLYYYLINSVNIKILPRNFLSKTTWCPFNPNRLSANPFTKSTCLILAVWWRLLSACNSASSRDFPWVGMRSEILESCANPILHQSFRDYTSKECLCKAT